MCCWDNCSFIISSGSSVNDSMPKGCLTYCNFCSLKFCFYSDCTACPLRSPKACDTFVTFERGGGSGKPSHSASREVSWIKLEVQINPTQYWCSHKIRRKAFMPGSPVQSSLYSCAAIWSSKMVPLSAKFLLLKIWLPFFKHKHLVFR